jgi:ribose 5-phosphate isomerase A
MDREQTAKRHAGERAAELVMDGMTVGLGTGSTVYWALQRLGERVRGGLRLRGIPTSRQTEELARTLGIPLTTFAEVRELDLAIDGADEIDAGLNLIKGGGGALLREKIVAAASRQLVVVADRSKVVATLGARPLPVEIVPFGHEVTMRRLAALGGVPTLRYVAGQPFVTDNGNLIADCAFGAIPDPARLERELKLVVGVVESGLFVERASVAIVGTDAGVEILAPPVSGARDH